MRQQTFATGDFERYRKPTRREQFLSEMDKVVPWEKLCALIEPHYPKAVYGLLLVLQALRFLAMSYDCSRIFGLWIWHPSTDARP